MPDVIRILGNAGAHKTAQDHELTPSEASVVDGWRCRFADFGPAQANFGNCRRLDLTQSISPIKSSGPLDERESGAIREPLWFDLALPVERQIAF